MKHEAWQPLAQGDEALNLHLVTVTDPTEFSELGAPRAIGEGIYKVSGRAVRGGIEAQSYGFDADVHSKGSAIAWMAENRPSKHTFQMNYKVKENSDGTVDILDVAVAKMGKWTDSSGRTKDWGEKEFSAIMEADEEAHDLIEPVFKIEHSLSGPAYGWLGKFRRKADMIFCNIRKVPKELYEQIKQGRFRGLSPEIQPNWKEPSTGKKYPFVLEGLALLGVKKRAMTSLPSLATFNALEGEDEKVYLESPEDSTLVANYGLVSITHRFNEPAEGKAATEPETIEHTEEDGHTMSDELKQRMAELDAREAELAEREKDQEKATQSLKADRVLQHTAKVKTALGNLVFSKKINPADVEAIEARMMRMDNEEVFEFAAAGSKVKGTAVDEYVASLMEGPAVALKETEGAGPHKEQEEDKRSVTERFQFAAEEIAEKQDIPVSDAFAQVEKNATEEDLAEYRAKNFKLKAKGGN